MYKNIKRSGDILLSLIAMLILLPLFIPLYIILKLTGEGYVFYLQDRIGFKNTKFKIWKFATMLLASPGLGTGSITLKNDWRLTPMGKILRSTKINEVPQIFNVFKGNMSLIGPRPLMEVDFLKFTPEIQATFYNVRPGITGIASIIFRDSEQYYSKCGMDPHVFTEKYIAPYKGALEIWYQDHLSFRTDFMLLFLTFWVIIYPKSDKVFKVFKDLPERPVELKCMNNPSLVEMVN